MLAVVAADVHVHPHRQYNTYDSTGRSSRVTWAVKALEQCLSLAERYNCAFFVLGDLLHDKRNVPTEVIDPLIEVFQNHPGVITYLVVGNHERPDHFSQAHNLGWLAAAFPDNIEVVSKPAVLSFRDFDAYVLPWTEQLQTDRLYQLLQEGAGQRPNTPRVLFGHACIDGAIADNGVRLSGEVKAADLHLPSFNLTLFGDIHKPQAIAENAWYVGALLQNRAGEDGNEDGPVLVTEDLTIMKFPLQGIPRFTRDEGTARVQETDEGEVYYTRPREEVIVEQAIAGGPEVRLDLEIGNMEQMVRAYMTQRPPADPAVTFERVMELLGARP